MRAEEAKDMSGLVQNYRPLRVFSFLYPSLPPLPLYSPRGKRGRGEAGAP